jgi:glucokinase
VSAIPVLEVGGTHVSAALVRPDTWAVTATTRLDLDPAADADTLLDRFAAAAAELDLPSACAWGVAMPDPFDYERGVGRFEGVGKFESLNGIDVRAGLRCRLRPEPTNVAFLNDADAFALGEWTAGAAKDATRCVGVTLGTGIGSGWLVDGRVVDPGNPPGGRAHRLHVAGRPLEDVVSRRAIRRAFADAGGDPGADVREITAAAQHDDRRAEQVVGTAFRALGAALGPVIAAFRADIVVVGGSMAASWQYYQPFVDDGAGMSVWPKTAQAAHPDTAPLVGAAVHGIRSGS